MKENFSKAKSTVLVKRLTFTQMSLMMELRRIIQMMANLYVARSQKYISDNLKMARKLGMVSIEIRIKR